MVVNSLILLLTINSIDFGVRFGPIFPAGHLEQTYKVTAVGSLFCSVNNFELNYRFSKFSGKVNNQNYLYLHSGTIAYLYPFYHNQSRLFNAILGGSYNRIIRKFEPARESGYALGVNYGIGYKEMFADTKFHPALLTQIYLSQIIQSHNWNSVQRITSNFLFSIMIGVSFRLR